MRYKICTSLVGLVATKPPDCYVLGHVSDREMTVRQVREALSRFGVVFALMEITSSFGSPIQLRDTTAYLMGVRHGFETDTGILIFRGYSQSGLAFLGGGARELLEECRLLHRFRDVL